MAHLAAVENFHHIDGGTILLGYFTALVPVRMTPDGTIQWHLEADESRQRILNPLDLVSLRSDWYKTKDLAELKSSKCVVGWFEHANIMLGTRELLQRQGNSLGWSSGCKRRLKSLRPEGLELAGQFGIGAGPINIAPTVTNTWKWSSNVQRFESSSVYRQAIGLSVRKVSLVIDTTSKQAWLVPLLSLILHLCHIYFHESRPGQDRRDDPLPFAAPEPDGASAALQALEPHGDLVVFGEAGNPDVETLRQLVLRINTNLSNACRTRENGTARRIYASELMDEVVQPSQGSALQELKATGNADAWKGIVNSTAVDFVGVCGGLGAAIEPRLPASPGCQCHALPRGEFLLAAHAQCPNELARKAGGGPRGPLSVHCKLGDDLYWKRRRRCLWHRSHDGGNASIWETRDFVQQITGKKKSPYPDTKPASKLGPLGETGVVVFGIGDVELKLLDRFGNFFREALSPSGDDDAEVGSPAQISPP